MNLAKNFNPSEYFNLSGPHKFGNFNIGTEIWVDFLRPKITNHDQQLLSDSEKLAVEFELEL
jgi:hypothetical protein